MKKKLLIIIHSLRRGGGAERVISNLTIHLSKKYNISILTIFDYKSLYAYRGNYYSLKENLGIVRKILIRMKFYTIIRPIRIYKLIRQISPDIILSNMDSINIYTILSKFIFQFKIPLIVVTHTNPKLAFRKRKRYLSILIKLFYSLNIVNKIITNSKGVKKILENDYRIKNSKLKTINNGIDIKRINEMKNKMIFHHHDLFYNLNITKFITIGRLTDLKGHKYLIDAFSEVKKEIANSKLIIIGEGPLRRQLEIQIQEKRLDDDVLLLGLKRNPYKYLAHSDIFVFSSKYEGLPVVLLEALACGLPIISTDCETGPREILDYSKYGILVKVMDSEELKEKMIILAKNQTLKEKYSKLSLKRAEFFNINNIVDIWINTIDHEI